LECHIFLSSSFDSITSVMDLELTTHAVFAFTVGLVFFGRADVALLVTLGALTPDLDREYWFVRVRKYKEEQPHRSRFHNVFVIALGFILSPFFALGIFLHSLQDSFTTAKDRGCEWFYPLTRLVKRGSLDADGNKRPNIKPGKIYLYQEDPKGIIEHADPDLREPSGQAVPWRRVYGPALNSCILDRGFLVGSILIAIIYLVTPGFSHLEIFYKPWPFFYPFVAGFAFFGFIYLAGELDRRDRERPLRVIPKAMIRHNNIFKKPLFAVGIIFLGAWIVLYLPEILKNMSLIFENWLPIFLGAVAIFVVAVFVIRLEIKVKRGKNAPAIV
jgi:hypothetical protein